jgi:GNAT superfamily N-acetyltransferase
MEIRVAVPDDVAQLAGLLGRFADCDQATGAAFAPDLLRWWSEHDSHVAFLAVLPSGDAVGMAWLALTERVPRPGGGARLSGDIQSVYVVPEHRPWVNRATAGRIGVSAGTRRGERHGAAASQ